MTKSVGSFASNRAVKPGKGVVRGRPVDLGDERDNDAEHNRCNDQTLSRVQRNVIPRPEWIPHAGCHEAQGKHREHYTNYGLVSTTATLSLYATRNAGNALRTSPISEFRCNSSVPAWLIGG